MVGRVSRLLGSVCEMRKALKKERRRGRTVQTWSPVYAAGDPALQLNSVELIPRNKAPTVEHGLGLILAALGKGRCWVGWWRRMLESYRM